MLILFFTYSLSAHPPKGLIPKNSKASHVTVPFYERGNPKPSMVLKVDHVYTDYERKGFFKIGVLPLAVFENVSLVGADSTVSAEHLRTFQNWLPHSPIRAELREFRILMGKHQVYCNRARLDSDGWLKLTSDVQFRSGTKLYEAREAKLSIASGEAAGTLVLLSEPPATFNLFAPEEPSRVNTSKNQ